MKGRSSVAFSLFAKANFKILMVGAKDAGKTSLIVRYIKKMFSNSKNVALGIEFYSSTVQVGKDEVALQLWDTAGSDNINMIAKSFYLQASCIVITYCEPSLARKTIEDFILEINENAQVKVVIVIVRTKIDQTPLTPEEKLILEEFVQKTQNMACWMAVSSKTGENVDHFFKTVANALYIKYNEDEGFKEIVDPKKESFVLNNDMVDQRKRKERKKCC